MRIKAVKTVPGLSGFYFDDQLSIKNGSVHNGFAYKGEPLTPGFKAIRQRGEAILFLLVLEDGQTAWGDCAAVQYSGAGGRDPLFLARDFIPLIRTHIVPRLVGRKLTTFREMAVEFDNLTGPDGKPLHTAIRYGVTQVLLDAVAKSRKQTMAEVIVAEYNLSPCWQKVSVFCQTGDDCYLNADKGIIKRASVLPHGLINNVEEKLGPKGEKLLQYISWLKGRIKELGGTDYHPTLHIDVYGTIGQAFDHNLEAIVSYLRRVEEAAAPYPIRIEGPVDMGSKPAQLSYLRELRQELQKNRVGVGIVADEWCNTLEDIKEFVDARAADMVQIKTPDLGGINNSIAAVLYAKQYQIGAYLGGTCNETDRSAQVCVHIALATQPDQMLAKPGMGVDEGYMIVYNEMQRTLALLEP